METINQFTDIIGVYLKAHPEETPEELKTK